MRLFESENINEVNFECVAFLQLFNKEKLTVDADGWTVLMWLCMNNP